MVKYQWKIIEEETPLNKLHRNLSQISMALIVFEGQIRLVDKTDLNFPLNILREII